MGTTGAGARRNHTIQTWHGRRSRLVRPRFHFLRSDLTPRGLRLRRCRWRSRRRLGLHSRLLLSALCYDLIRLRRGDGRSGLCRTRDGFCGSFGDNCRLGDSGGRLAFLERCHILRGCRRRSRRRLGPHSRLLHIALCSDLIRLRGCGRRGLCRSRDQFCGNFGDNSGLGDSGERLARSRSCGYRRLRRCRRRSRLRLCRAAACFSSRFAVT